MSVEHCEERLRGQEGSIRLQIYEGHPDPEAKRGTARWAQRTKSVPQTSRR